MSGAGAPLVSPNLIIGGPAVEYSLRRPPSEKIMTRFCEIFHWKLYTYLPWSMRLLLASPPDTIDAVAGGPKWFDRPARRRGFFVAGKLSGCLVCSMASGFRNCSLSMLWIPGTLMLAGPRAALQSEIGNFHYFSRTSTAALTMVILGKFLGYFSKLFVQFD